MTGHEFDMIPPVDLFPLQERTAGPSPSATPAMPAGTPQSACQESVLPALEQLPALERSPLHKQQLTHDATASQATRLTRLTFLQMDNCRLRAVPVWLAQLTSLRSLSLAGNYLGAHKTGEGSLDRACKASIYVCIHRSEAVGTSSRACLLRDYLITFVGPS